MPKKDIPSGELKAKKDFLIVHNEYRKQIKKGDDCAKIPKMYLQNLKTEKVI